MANNSNTLVAVLTGVAIGAAAGILFAPDKGENTRGKIKDGIKDKKNELKDKYGDLSEKLKAKFARGTADVESTFDHLVSAAGDKADEVIATLESKLREFKKGATAAKDKY